MASRRAVPPGGENADSGTSLVEYVLLVGLIALVALVSLRFFGSSRDNSLSRSASSIGGVVRINLAR